MASLPKCRVNRQCLAFAETGVDYFGPKTVTIGRRTEKRYGVLFTCLLTRETENGINNHPLTHVLVDHADNECLTPNNFLLGSLLCGNFSNNCLRKQWRLAQMEL